MKLPPYFLNAALMAAITSCGTQELEVSLTAPSVSARWCDALPREVNLGFERVDIDSDWFGVRKVEDGVFALIEANQFQETVSYLILGSERALMFDTGLGMSPIRQVAEQITSLPIVVVNSHTHYYHVGGNAEFDRILAVDSPYTRSNQRGFPHSELTGEVAAESFCDGPPEGLYTLSFHTVAWTPSGTVRDGEKLDLGGRVLEVLHIPGHTHPTHWLCSIAKTGFSGRATPTTTQTFGFMSRKPTLIPTSVLWTDWAC